jgi:hypothetical protein
VSNGFSLRIRCLAIAVRPASPPRDDIPAGWPLRNIALPNTAKKNENSKLSGGDNGCEIRPNPAPRRARAITIKNLRIFSLPSAGLLSMLPGSRPRRSEKIL